MKVWLLKFFGIDATSSGRVAEMSLALRGAENLGWVLLLSIALGIATIWMYRRVSDFSPARRNTLSILRICLLVLLFLLLLQPTLLLTVEGSVRRALVFMFDNSTSMKIEDARTQEIDRKRAGVVMGVEDAKSNQLDHPSRIQLVSSAMSNEKLGLLKKLGKDFDLRLYSFGQRITELQNDPKSREPWSQSSLNAASPVTPLGDSLREILSRSRGQPLAGIVLVTDGQSNSGNAPLAAADSAASQNVPLFTWGVGLPTARDIVVASVFAPEIAFIDDEVPVTVRVRGLGLQGETGTLAINFGDQKVDEKAITFDQDGEQVLSMKLKPQKAGEYEISATIDPRADEVVKDNNKASQKIRVVDGKIKVLFVEQQPRWEFKYIQTLLLRDRRVELKCFLSEADEGVTKDANSPYLARFPRTKEELLKYDLVILGDVDPNNFSQLQFDWINEFVSQFGGGLLVITGRRFGPQAWERTPIEKMLPVEIGTVDRFTDVTDKAFRLELTPAGERNVMLRLSDQPVESKRIWLNLAPIYWTARVQRAKPAAEVLLVDPDPDKAYRGAKMPVLALQQYGLGQVMFSGTDNTWRWRKNAGDKHHATLWGQIVQRLSLPHLLGESKRTQLTTDRTGYSTGDRVTIYARLYDEAYAAVKDPVVRGVAKGASGEMEIMLRALPDQPGMFRGEFVAPAPGSYGFSVQRDPKTILQIDVSEPRVEMGESTMNESLLTEMAKITGGQFLHEDDLPKLPEMVKARTELVRSKQEVELWTSPFYFSLLVAVAGVEWALRKKWQLK